ncbi:uncharacterized protein LOC135502540 isoform X1 [Lineus longissimus]|uniref:uncharacterized protein LOC135502540 isoform X1 n=2 Tax=Lineus longissimus TaxID=88925 RepID=UPI00315D751A
MAMLGTANVMNENGPSNDMEGVPRPTVNWEVKPSKRKRFPIGQWARDQKLKTVKEASNTRAEQLQSDIYRKEERISELNAHIEWLERLEVDKNANITPKIMRDKQVQVCSNSANQLLVDQENGQIPGKQKTPTHLSPANPDQCMMSRSTTSARMKETTKAMKLIHGNNIKNVKDATWLSLVKLCTPNELNDYIQRSKSCKTALFKKGKVKKRKKIQERNARKNVVRCVETLYKGGMISSRKYNSIRCSNLGHSEPESLTYKELKQELDAIMEETRTQPVEGCGGVYRDFETTLLKLAEIYLKIDGVLVEQSGSGLNWFGKNRGNFAIAIGADGAPSGKHNTKTSLLLSFVNAVDQVSSCDHNYLIFGADLAEDDPIFFSHLAKIIGDMGSIERKEYEVLETKVTFSLELIPGDCKWIASACGELSNAATYPSSFGNVTQSSLSTLNGSIGESEDDTWHPWGYLERLETVKKVAALKKTVFQRPKITKFIAQQQSRQEFAPVLRKYTDKCYIDPLHVKNNACQQMNNLLMMEVINLTKEAVLKKNLDCPEFVDSPIGRYLSALKNEIKAGKLHHRICKWYKEVQTQLSRKGVASKCTVRFTGEDSLKFCNGFHNLTSIIFSARMDGEEIGNKCLRPLVLHFCCTVLREAVALFSKTKFSECDLVRLRHVCKMYHAAHALFLTGVSLTTWHIGYAVPYHATIIYHKFGVGLGLNSMQGREAKHQQIDMYQKFTTAQNKWALTFKHEYVQLFWLKEQGIASEARDMAKSVACVQNIA